MNETGTFWLTERANKRILVSESQNRRVIGSVPAHRRRYIATEGTEDSEIGLILSATKDLG